MEIIVKQDIATVDSMTNEDASFPKENMITLIPGQQTKATGTSTTIGMSAEGTSIAFHNCYAVSGTVTVKDNVTAIKTTGVNLSITATSVITRSSGSFISEGYTATDPIFLKGFTADNNNGFFTIAAGGVAALTLTVDEITLTTEGSAASRTIIDMVDPQVDAAALQFNTTLNFSILAIGVTNTKPDVWYDFGRQFSDCTIKLTMLGGTGITPVKLGLVQAGYKIFFGRSQYGFTDGRKDLSITTQTTSGSYSSTTRAILREPQGTVVATLEHVHSMSVWLDAQNQFGYSMKYTKGAKYQEDSVIFAFLATPPAFKRDSPEGFEYNIRMKEIK